MSKLPADVVASCLDVIRLGRVLDLTDRRAIATAAMDNSAPLATHPESTYKSGKVVQTKGATSEDCRLVSISSDK